MVSFVKINGDENLEQAEKIWQSVFKNIAEVLSNGGSYYICAPQGGDQMMMMMMMMKAYIPCKHELMWIKSSPVFSMGRLDYDYQHEPILYGWVGSHNFKGMGKFKKSVWEIGRDKGNYRDWETDRKSTRLNSSHRSLARMPSSA